MTTLRTLLSSIAILALAIGLAACTSAGAAASSSPSGPVASADVATGIAGTATAGPTCPVESASPDPSCTARPVVGAVLIVRDGKGAEVARATTDATGAFTVSVPAGAYTLEPQAAVGLMGTPAAQPVTVQDGSVAKVDLVYDTGIRAPVTTQ
jgi:hypothetical protein